MGDRATDRAAVTHLRVADVAGRVLQQRGVLGEQVGVLDVVVPGERADGDVVAVLADVAQVAEAADVDEHARLRQAQLHQRQQAVAAGDQLGLVAVLAEQADGLLGGAGPDVVEGGGDHAGAPAFAAASTAWTMLW